ncbi:hypothetical protein D3C86_1830110 [compost metagenome]
MARPISTWKMDSQSLFSISPAFYIGKFVKKLQVVRQLPGLIAILKSLFWKDLLLERFKIFTLKKLMMSSFTKFVLNTCAKFPVKCV